MLFSTVAVALLLLGAFPGLYRASGASARMRRHHVCVFVYSFFRQSISLLAVGFGGAIVSFTVDYGIAYLLFLDRPRETRGLEASRAGLVPRASRHAHNCSGFCSPQPERFSGPCRDRTVQRPGRGFYLYFRTRHFPPYICNHARGRPGAICAAAGFCEQVASSHTSWKAPAAIAFAIIMLFFARPDFHIDLISAQCSEPARPWQLKSLYSRSGAIFPAASSS